MSKSHKILVVEDDKIAQVVAKRMLENKGYIVECASSGADAVSLAKANTYDLIFMDIGLGDTDGYIVTIEIRKMMQHAQTPIVALTAHSLDEVNPKAMACGMNDAINKPLTNELIERVVEQFL